MAVQLSQAQQDDPNTKKRVLDMMPEDSAEIILKYQANLAKENARIISSKNRYEVNEQLQEFQSQKRGIAQAVNDNNKVSYYYPEDHQQAFQNDDNPVNRDQQVRLVTNFSELANQAEIQYSEPLSLKMSEITEYASLIEFCRPEVVSRLKKDSINETASNILISDDELSQMFGKGDFQKLNVIGQFNKGFIMCTKNNNEDLFILDQHACDEKFNFEAVSRETVLHT